MRRISGWLRLGISASALWLLGNIVLCAMDSSMTPSKWVAFLTSIGIIPLMILWSIWWVISGFRSQNPDQ